MCGLLFAKNNRELVNKTTLDFALNLMERRGPDQWNSESLGNIYLGHRRLAILDLNERSRQPFISSNKDLHIIFNGEIYNYLELKVQFGIETKTNSDTEVLLELFQKIGPKCLQYLNGIFAFVIFDSKTGSIFACRDRLGVKPLYYHLDSNSIIISSEIAPILSITGDASPDNIGIRQYLKARATFRGHTIYKHIKIMPPGHYFHNGEMHCYWSLEQQRDTWHDDDIKELVQSSIRYRLIADVPVGTYLSGGLDSSIITAVAKTRDSYTVGFAEENEFYWSERVANFVGTNHTALEVSFAQYMEAFEWMVKRRKEPLSVPNEVLIYLMTREVKKRNTVVLSGEGADELFFGYDRIFRWAAQDRWSLPEFDKLYSYGTHQDDEILDYILEPYSHHKNSLEKIAYFFQLDHLEGLLKRLDYSTMLCSVEAREPFVDYRLVEYMAGASINYRMKNGETKAPLKRIFGDLLPNENVHRRKIGFPVPLARMFEKTTHREGMQEWLDTNMRWVFPDWQVMRTEIFSRDLEISI